jgi:hypothetical protein
MSELSTSEFESIVNAVAAEQSGIVSVTTSGFHVVVMVLPRSRKGYWRADCDFDPSTGDVSYRAAYPESTRLGFFLDEVQGRIRNGA